MSIDKKRIEFAINEILLAIGEDPNREGLKETPRRVANMYEEIFGGLEEEPSQHLKIFCEDCQEDVPIIIKDIPLSSMCEHHLLPFIGVVHIAYIPRDGKIIGLSKFSRIVNCFAKRPQVQERLTNQIADFIFKSINPIGVAVIIEAEHLCMTMRGTKAVGSKTQTITLRGEMKTNHNLKRDILSLITRSNT